tara:strand:- start:185 stop:1843 length:1659 start_codon:yes stop_codon:yes gene_type:complete
MADDEIKRLAGSLNDLNSTLSLADTNTLTFIRRLGTIADTTSKQGKAWTTFSRLVSGSPIWALQNKARAYIDILASFERNARKNAEATKEANQRVIDQVQSYKALEPQLQNLQKLKESMEQNTPFGDPEALDNIKEAVKGTLAFNKALLEGKTAEEQFAAGLDELISKGQRQTEIFNKAQEAVQAKLKFETQAGRDELKQEITGRRESLEQGLVNFRLGDAFEPLKERLTAIRKFATGNYTLAEKSAKLQKRQDKIEKRRVKREILAIKLNQGIFKVSQMVKPMLNIVFKFLIFSIFAFMGILLFLKFAKDAFMIMEELLILDDLRNIFYTSIEMIGAFFGLVGAFFSGDYELVIDYLMTLIDGSISILKSVGLAALKVATGLLVGFFFTIIDNIGILFTPKFWERALPVLKKFGTILLVAYFAKYLLAQAALLIGIYALPLMIFVLIAALLTALFRKIFDKLPFMANGGVSQGGLTVVGERGPELVNLPAGSRVHSNSDSRRMVSNTGGNTINITINARDTTDAELRRIADKIGNMVNNKINRRTSSRTLG